MAATAGDILLGGATLGVGNIVKNQIDKQKEGARNAVRAIQDQQRRLEQEMRDRSATEDANAQRDLQRATQKTRMGSYGGRGSTILTSPLGLTGNAGETRKTLLGM